MVKKTKKIIRSSIHIYKEHNLLDKFNTFVKETSEASITTEAQDREKSSSNNPEQLLFLAVVYQALLDATKEGRYNDSEEVHRHRREATNWFTLEYGTTATDFEEICYLAGLEPSSTRSFAKKILSKEIKFERKRINVLINFNKEEKKYV